MDEINERIELAKEQVQHGEMSPIYYFMEVNKMDVTILICTYKSSLKINDTLF